MLTRYSRWLTGYGIFLILMGLALIAYNPQTGNLELYWTAHTGFYVAAGFGVAALLCAALARSGHRAALWAGLVISFLAMIGFFMSANKFRRASTMGEPHKAYAAVVIGLMAAASLGSVVTLGRGARALPNTLPAPH